MAVTSDVLRIKNNEYDDDFDSLSDTKSDSDDEEECNYMYSRPENKEQNTCFESNIDLIINNLGNALNLLDEIDFQERAPTRKASNYRLNPYNINRTGGYYSGGTISQNNNENGIFENDCFINNFNYNNQLPNYNENLLASYGNDNQQNNVYDSPTSNLPFYLPETVSSENEENILNLNENSSNDNSLFSCEIDDFLNNLNDSQTSNLTFKLIEDLFPSENQDELLNFNQNSNDVSSLLSYETDSPQSILNDSPSFICDLPATLPTLSENEDEELTTSATDELRSLIDKKYKDIKKQEWISSNNKDYSELISDLKRILNKKSMEDKNLVQIYAIICTLMKINRNCLQTFLNKRNVLLSVIRKEHPLFLRYTVEVMRNLQINPQNKITLKEIIELKYAPTILDTLLNLRIFDINEKNDKGYTIIHYVIYKIATSAINQDKYRNKEYLKILLSHQPDFSIVISNDNLTYLHYAMDYECDLEVIEMLLIAAQNFNCDFINKRDMKGFSALDRVNWMQYGQSQMKDLLLHYNAVPLNASNM